MWRGSWFDNTSEANDGRSCSAIAGAVIFGAAAIIVPAEEVTMDPNGKVDYLGSYLGVGGLILFNYSWTLVSVKTTNSIFTTSANVDIARPPSKAGVSAMSTSSSSFLCYT